jgi:hypothetical protein
MGLMNSQYALLLLRALPPSYEKLTAFLLAVAPPGKLSAEDIVSCAINEEGHYTGPSSLLNSSRAPICNSDKGKGWDHSNLTCHYCKKKGHIAPNCHKKKKDLKDKEKGGK